MLRSVAGQGPALLHHMARGARRAAVTARIGRFAARRPSREAIVLTLAAVGGCAAIIGGIAGIDELAGALAT